jgi:hypothetical protein
LVGPAVDLARRRDEDPSLGRLEPDGLEHVHGADGVGAPRLSRVLPGSAYGRESREVHDRRRRGRRHRSRDRLRVRDVHIDRQAAAAQLGQQMAADEALGAGDEDRTAHGGDPSNRVLRSR